MGAKIAPKISEAFEVAGKGVLSGLKNWWKGPVKSSAEIREVLEGAGGLESALDDVTKLGKGAYERLINSLKGGTNEIKQTFLEKLNEAKVLRNRLSIDESRLVSLTRSKPSDPDKLFQWEEAVNRLQDIIENSREQFAKLEKELGSANKFVQTLDTEGVEKSLKLLNDNPDLMVEFPRLGKWKDDATKQLLDWHSTYRAKSFNIDSAKKFLKEYAEIMSRPADDPYRVAFLTNTENKNYLSSLRGASKKIGSMIRAIESPSAVKPRTNLIGSIVDIAKKIGLTAGAVGAGIAGIKVYNWFNSNSPHKVANDAETLESNLRNIKATGEGATIINNVNTSLNNIARIADQTNAALGENPEKAAGPYVAQITKELNNLVKYLNQWNKVVSNTADKEQAISVGKQLGSFITKFNDALKALGKEVGVSVSSLNVSLPNSQSLKPSEVEKIQSLLNKNGYKIPITGKVDEATISALEALERSFPAGRTGKDITGSFVNRATGNIISYNDLVNALNILEK